MSRFISLRYDTSHTHCSICQTDCFHNTFYLKECSHSYCMKCVSLYFDGLKKDISFDCPACINILPKVLVSKEVLVHRLPHELRQGHKAEASLLR